MEINLESKHWVLFGVKDSGKSYLADKLMQKAADNGKLIVIFDPMDEYSDHENIMRIIPTAKRGQKAIDELDRTLEEIEDRKEEIDYFLCDEISRFHSKGGELKGPLGEMIDLNAHWDMGVGFVCRRPTQMHTDIREMADWIFVFALRGRNDVKSLDEISNGLTETMEEMVSNEPWHSYIAINERRDYDIHPPI